MAACAPAAGPADPVPETRFAPSLGIDLAAYTREESGLYVSIVRPGAGAVARAGDEVTVHYEAWFSDGTKFDSSRDRGVPLRGVPLGRDVVIDGWDEGIAGMRVGEVRRLIVPPHLAYGDEGVAGAIPPDATLVFEIELLDVR